MPKFHFFGQSKGSNKLTSACVKEPGELACEADSLRPKVNGLTTTAAKPELLQDVIASRLNQRYICGQTTVDRQNQSKSKQEPSLTHLSALLYFQEVYFEENLTDSDYKSILRQANIHDCPSDEEFGVFDRDIKRSMSR